MVTSVAKWLSKLFILNDARVTDISLNNKSSQWSFQQLYHLYKRTVG